MYCGESWLTCVMGAESQILKLNTRVGENRYEELIYLYQLA